MGALFECLGELLNGFGPEFYVLHNIIKFFELSVAPIIPIVISTAFYPIKSRYLVFVPNAIHIVLEFLSLFYGFIFNIDENNNYTHGKFYFIYYIILFFGVIFLIATAVKFGANLQNRNNISLTMIALLVFTGLICQVIDRTLKVVWLTVAIAAILFYIYYCNMVLQIDSLTKLLNRRSFDSRRQMHHKRVLVIVFDVNNFKSINDKYGHAFGDYCLKTVGGVIKSVYGKNGQCYRIGGDEFCVILDRRIDLIDIENLNEKFKNALSEENKTDSRMPTVALGYTTFEPKKMGFDEAVAIADEQMYKNKKI